MLKSGVAVFHSPSVAPGAAGQRAACPHRQKGTGRAPCTPRSSHSRRAGPNRTLFPTGTPPVHMLRSRGRQRGGLLKLGRASLFLLSHTLLRAVSLREAALIGENTKG